MLIKKLTVKNFRNITNLNIDTSAKRVILMADNGQGKTNLLEAVYMACYGSSFRTSNLKDCINHGSGSFFVKAFYDDPYGLGRTSEVFFGCGGNEEDSRQEKIIKIDSKEIRDRKDLIYNIPCIVFSHEDIEFVRGEPEMRRRFFDQTMTMYDPLFFDYLRRYKQVLKQRNASLKTGRLSLLDIYDQRLATYGKAISQMRGSVCELFSKIFQPVYSEVSGTERKVYIVYRPSWSDELSEDEIIEKLRAQRDVDIKMKSTTSGPHRDRFVLMDENGLFVNSASTGQMRLASVVMRSAQAEFFRQKTEKNPIFLIDDVLLEMDAGKRAKYLSVLGDYDQAFFTFLPDESYFDSYFDYSDSATMVYTVSGGNFERAGS